jgi:hypothetical protein
VTDELVLLEGGHLIGKADEELLWEAVASHYLRLQEERQGKKVRITEALEAALAAHPGEYDDTAAKVSVLSPGFDDYLAGRRKEYMLRSLVPSLYAAETGLRLGSMAAEELARRAGDPCAVAEMSDKDLLAIMKAGFDYAKQVDQKVEDLTGNKDVKVQLDIKNLLLGLSPDEMSEFFRRAAIEAK